MAEESKYKNIPVPFRKSIIWENGCPVWNGNRNNKQPFIQIDKKGVNVVYELFGLLHNQRMNSKTHCLEPTCSTVNCVDPVHRVLIERRIYNVDHRQRTIDRLMKYSTLLENGCRIWTGTRNEEGFGIVSTFNSPKELVHCLWFDATHPNLTIEEKNLEIVHNCENKACFIHGRLGEAIREGKVRSHEHVPIFGEDSPNATISNATAREIFAEKTSFMPGLAEAVAEKYGTTKKIVKSIWGGQDWSRITNPSNAENSAKSVVRVQRTTNVQRNAKRQENVHREQPEFQYTAEQREMVKKVVELQHEKTFDELADMFGVKRRVISTILYGRAFSAISGIQPGTRKRSHFKIEKGTQNDEEENHEDEEKEQDDEEEILEEEEKEDDEEEKHEDAEEKQEFDEQDVARVPKKRRFT